MEYLCIEKTCMQDFPQDVRFKAGKMYTLVEHTRFNFCLIDEIGRPHGCDGDWRRKFIVKPFYLPYGWYKLRSFVK